MVDETGIEARGGRKESRPPRVVLDELGPVGARFAEGREEETEQRFGRERV